MERHELYELCVQSPRDAVRMLRAIHGGDPRRLAEDFCGTGAVSREWCLGPGCSAVGVDLDAGVVERARSHGVAGAEFRVGDATAVHGAGGGCDVVFVGNFSIGEIHERATLVGYMRRTLQRLRHGGVLVCDTYGGESAFRVGAMTRPHVAPDGGVVQYTWEHRAADAATGMVENAIHFRVLRAGEVVHEQRDAFVYRWRLWSVPELRDAMREAGFARTSVHTSLGGEECVSLDADYIACVAGRRG